MNCTREEMRPVLLLVLAALHLCYTTSPPPPAGWGTTTINGTLRRIMRPMAVTQPSTTDEPSSCATSRYPTRARCVALPQAAGWTAPIVTALRPADCRTTPCSDGLPRPTRFVEDATVSSTQSLTFAQQHYTVAPFSLHQTGALAESNSAACPLEQSGVTCPSATSCLVLADLDGDGDLDLLSEERTGSFGQYTFVLRMHLNNGAGVFAEHITSGLNTAGNANRVEVEGNSVGPCYAADFNGDGHVDIVALGTAGSALPSSSTMRGPVLWVNDGLAAGTAPTFTPDATCNAESAVLAALSPPSSPIPSSASVPRFQSMVAGDVNADGKLDLLLGLRSASSSSAIGNEGSGAALLLSNAAGKFATILTPGTTECANAGQVLLGDMNGDSKLDLVCSSVSKTTVLLNDGTATAFSPAGTITRGSSTRRCSMVALGDVDGDGDLDMALAYVVGANKVYRNGGDGATFTEVATSFSDAVNTFSVSLADLDGDGDLDLFFGQSSPGQNNELWINDGAGVFSALRNTLAIGSTPAAWMQIGDINNDGMLDILVASYHLLWSMYEGGVCIYGTIEARPGTCFITQFWTAQRKPTFQRDATLSAQLSNLARMHRYSEMNAKDAGTEEQAAFETQSLILGDVDGDSDIDMVLHRRVITSGCRFGSTCGSMSFANAIDVVSNSARGSFAVAAGGGILGVADVDDACGLADLNGDGLPELVVARVASPSAMLDDTSLRYHTNTGGGSFSTTATSIGYACSRTAVLGGNSKCPTNLATGDLNGDGHVDIVDCQGNTLINDGTGRFTVKAQPNLAGSQDDLALGDMDGDGDLDLVTRSRGLTPDVDTCSNNCFISGELHVFKNDGTGSFAASSSSAAVNVHAQYQPTFRLGDLDMDGDLDIISSRDLFCNDGSGGIAACNFQLPDSPGTPGYIMDPASVLLADADDDGDLDILVRSRAGNGGNGLDELAVSDGAGGFALDQSTSFTRTQSAKRGDLLAADLDGDGDLEVILKVDLADSNFEFGGTEIEVHWATFCTGGGARATGGLCYDAPAFAKRDSAYSDSMTECPEHFQFVGGDECQPCGAGTQRALGVRRRISTSNS